MTTESPTPQRSGSRLGSLMHHVRESLSGVQHDHTKGPLGRSVALLAIPMVLEMVLESTFAVADVWFVARLGKDAISTVGLTESVITLLYALALGLSMATTATVGRRIGEGDNPGAVRAATQAIVIGVLVAVSLAIPGVLFAGDVLQLMGAEASVIETGSGYTSILFGTNIVILLLFLNNAIFRGAGDPLVAMKALWLANGLNLILDPLLIFGLGPIPAMGIEGAAIATSIGRGVGVLYQFRCLRTGSSRVRLAGPAFRIDFGVASRLLKVSFGGVVQLLIATASWAVLNALVARFGSAASAGFTVAIRIAMFVFLPAWGLSNAAATMVGQNLGAKQPDRAERAVWLTGLCNMAFLAVVTVVFVAIPETLVSLFTSEPEVVAVAARSLRILSYGYVFYAWGMVLMQAFNGAGDTMTPTWLNLFCFWCWQIPMAWYLAFEGDAGPDGVFWSVAICEAGLTVLSLLVFRRGRWKTREV